MGNYMAQKSRWYKNNFQKKPRNYKSPYTCFMLEQKPIFIREYRNWNMMKIMCQVAKKWGTLSPKEREPYVIMSE